MTSAQQSVNEKKRNKERANQTPRLSQNANSNVTVLDKKLNDFHHILKILENPKKKQKCPFLKKRKKTKQKINLLSNSSLPSYSTLSFSTNVFIVFKFKRDEDRERVSGPLSLGVVSLTLSLVG